MNGIHLLLDRWPMKTYLLQLLVVLSASAALKLSAAIHFVDGNNTSPSPPFLTWTDAARTIQDAIDVSSDGDEILVTNGVYATGGRVVFGAMTNRVAVVKAVTVRSVQGPSVTSIQGFQVPGTTNGDAAVRCVYLADGAKLIGFTLTQGATRQSSGMLLEERSAGGIWCESGGSTVSNCVLTGNAAFWTGGGAYQGTFNNCLITGNTCANYGGGTYQSILNNCVIRSNTAPIRGGGVYLSTLNNCLVVGNAANFGGGAYYSDLNNCTVSANTAMNGGGVYQGNLNNCIVWYNSAPDGNGSGGFLTANYSCIIPLIAGPGNFTNAPLLVNPATGDFHLQANSPCINSGNNPSAPATPDLDGLPRIAGGTVDVGAYEFPSPASKLSYLWLQQHGLPIDGSADFIDSDSDRMNNWQEWIAGTVPIDPSSLLTFSSSAKGASGFTLNWQSVSGKTYFVQRSADLLAPFTAIQSNIVGQAGTTSYTDTSASGSGPFFYRVGVQ
jgi:hypothetical protein